MKISSLGLTAFLLTAPCIICAAPSCAQAPVATVLAAAKAASGGQAWDRVTTLHMKGFFGQSGTVCDYEEWNDLPTGRFTVMTTLGPNATAQGNDGKVVWNQDATGQFHVVSAAPATKAVAFDSFIVALFSAFPSRLSLTGLIASRTVENEHTYDVLSLTPPSKYSFTLWVDTSTHLIDRSVAVIPGQTITTFYSNYQKVSGVLLPFEVRQNDGNILEDKVYTYHSVEVNAIIPDTRFALPPPPAPDYTFDGGKLETTVPFHESDDHLYFDVKIDGQGPFSAVLDSGGSFVLSADTAKRLRLDSHHAIQVGGMGASISEMSMTRAGEIQFGNIRISRPLFMVGALATLPEHLQSIAGQEVLTRFVVRIDYDKHLLTFTRPDAFTYHGTGTIVPFRLNGFNGTTPEVAGTVDGIPGVFAIDTGASGSLTLTSPFVSSNDLMGKYKPKITTVTGYGIGGLTRGAVTRVHVMTIGGVTAHELVADLSLDTAGYGSAKTLAGNIGEGILHQFNLIFDYTRQRIIFEKNSRYDKPEIFNRAGLSLLESGVVIAVIPGSPAETAGISVGDNVLAMNGESPATLSNDGIYRLLHQPVGTSLALQVRSRTQVHTVTVILRDLL